MNIGLKQPAIAILHRNKTPARRGATPPKGQPSGAVGK